MLRYSKTMQDSSPRDVCLPVAIIAAACVALLGMAAISVYELGAFDWHPAREERAAFSTYHYARTALSVLLSLVLVAATARPWLRPDAADIRPLEPNEIRNGYIVAALAAAATALLVWSPNLFHWFAREDNILEWLAPLFVLTGAWFFFSAGLRHARQRPEGFGPILIRVLVPLSFAGLYFLIGMEEVSWGQRIFGFETPEGIAERNWQSEFNLHNIHTDIAEFVFYLGTGVFLIVLPLAHPSLRRWRPVKFFADFVPNRSVAALSAPMVFFSYGHWNLVPIQMLTFVTLLAMIIFAIGASRRGWVGESRLFAALALLIAVGQILVLIFGSQMIDVPDATEFREFFIPLGLFAFAAYYYFDVTPRARAATPA
jgi:hypothetical protein